MLPKSSLYLKVLMNRYMPGAVENSLKSLSKNEVKQIFGQSTASQDPGLVFRWPDEEIQHTHYSWLAAVLKSYPEYQQNLMVRALPKTQSPRVAELLKLPAPSNEPLSPLMQSFLLQMFWKKWAEKPSLPKAYLPVTPLSSLLSLSKAELVDLIDFCALHDLAESIRHIVDKKQIKSLLDTLSPVKQQFLRMCLHQKDKVDAPKLEIEKWNGDPRQLNLLLHRRGMVRVGKALSGQHPDFLWHIVHTLDSGRGSIILKYYSPNEIPNITSLLAQQILSVLNFLKKKSESRE